MHSSIPVTRNCVLSRLSTPFFICLKGSKQKCSFLEHVQSQQIPWCALQGTSRRFTSSMKGSAWKQLIWLLTEWIYPAEEVLDEFVLISVATPLYLIMKTISCWFYGTTKIIQLCTPSIAHRISLPVRNMFTIFTYPSARAGYDTRSMFKRSLTGLNSEFSFS